MDHAWLVRSDLTLGHPVRVRDRVFLGPSPAGSVADFVVDLTLLKLKNDFCTNGISERERGLVLARDM